MENEEVFEGTPQGPVEHYVMNNTLFRDYFLRFASKSEAVSVMHQAGLTSDRMDPQTGRPVTDPYDSTRIVQDIVSTSEKITVVVVGDVVKQAEVLDSDGKLVSPVVYAQGYHVNLRVCCKHSLPEVLIPFTIEPPSSPVNVFF